MKILLLIPLLLLIVSPAFGQLSDRTGLTTHFDVETAGHSYEIESTSNYDISDYEFNRDEKRLTIFISSGLENNLGELIIPKILLGGNFTFYLNDLEFNPNVRSNEKISFITLNFNGTGNNKLDIFATDVLVGVKEIPKPVITEPESEGGGCLIATATYGSEMAPKVQLLRELRDNQLLNTASGTNFMKSFNEFYYSFSPNIADYQRESPVFKEMVKITITPLLLSLSLLDNVEMNSEETVLGYGIGMIVLNGMMYVGFPILGLMYLRKIF